MAQIMRITFIVFLTISAVYAEEGWPEPLFKDPLTKGIVFESVPNKQAIRMDEELKVPLKIAVINYNGKGTPVIGSFTVGSNQTLHLNIEYIGKIWKLYVYLRQDFENPAQRRYEFEIFIQGDNTVKNRGIISLVTRNIFDNDPSITYNGPCVAPELHANYNTQCKFTVYDPDGLLDNEFTLKIEGSNNEDTLFEFRNEKKIDDYSMEYTLFTKVELRYEIRALYNFITRVFDIAKNQGSVTTIVEITDEPSLDPIWVTPFATAKFLEKTQQNFQVRAIDGDTGINKTICYKLNFTTGQNYNQFISIDNESGRISISPIDRDALQQEVFQFTVVAYKCYNETWKIDGDAVIIVDDVNDNYPEITATPSVIKIKEATYLTLPLEEFIVNDIDLGRHATYMVELSSPGIGEIFAKPFTVIPNKGYQESSFIITVSNAKPLDYEDDDWRNFKLKIVATEEDYKDRFKELEFSIELINWNDEFPIFNNTEFSIDVLETVDANQLLTTITATDRDIGDNVIHTIVGFTELSITEKGEISTRIRDTFDYERQISLLVQIKATDTLQTYENEKLNSAFAQLTINVIDVNDETPEIRMPRTSPTIEENSVGNTIVTEGIIAKDPDGTADLVFNIDWASSYATKSGQEAEKRFYENCFIIEPNKTDRNNVIGRLKVNPDFELDIDYEEYEVIYLFISVTDLNQEVNDDTADGILTIRIEDVNDNAPQFILNTLETERSVVEEALGGTLIGTIFAEDIDGPQFNKITYSISPQANTPQNLVEINSVNGAITVKENAKIDCDDPKIFNLSYIINISDGELETNGEIQVRVIDINNKSPTVGVFDSVIKLYENITTGDEIVKIPTFDMDRDAPHNIIQHMINYVQFPNLLTYFEIELLTGTVKVRLQADAIFDRDRKESEYDIHVNVEDNYQGNGRTNVNNTMLKLVLLDVNDNAPEMPSPQDFRPSISENADIGSQVGQTFYAPDIDDENTPNAWVGYRIIGIKPGNNTKIPVPNADNLFEIVSYEKKYGTLKVNKTLRGYYGTWLVTIEAFDHGHEWDSQIQLKSEETYEVIVEPYNFEAPKLINPTNGQTHRLSFDDQQVGKPLLLADKTIVPQFVAEDSDGGIFGKITFEITNYANGNDIDYFEIVQETDKQSRIHLKSPIEAKFYQLNVRGVDGGGRYSEWATNVVFVFIDLTGEPVFEMSIHQTDFTENITGLEEERVVPVAHDPKNVGIEDESQKYAIYYFIDKNYRPADAKLFQLDPVSRIMKLTQQLDRESIDNHEIRIIATNRRDGPENAKENSMILINITVNDVNDNPPQFEINSYGAGITPTDWMGKEILTVKAFDPDLDDIIRYVIVEDSLSAKGENLDEVLRTAFDLDPSTGVIKLNFAVSTSMKGYIEFTIQAIDLVEHTDECSVKIFIISESSRVKFVLLNPKPVVDQHTAYLSRTFHDYYGYECNIDDVLKSEINGVAQDNITDVRAHFINNNEAIEATEILARSNDIIFITKLKSALLEESINLLDVPNNDYLESTANIEQIMQTILIVLSAVLGMLLIALNVVYFIRTRSLKRQLKALSTTDFGSNESNLNRREAPTTNVFSIEGSNPVLNNNGLSNGVFDKMSVNSDTSEESDFDDIDNDPTFVTNGKRDSVNVAVINGIHKRNSPIESIKEYDEYDEYKKSDIGTYKF